MNDSLKLILASGSPRRKDLLTQVGLEFTVCVSTVEEVVTQTLPQEVVMELSAQKARDVARQMKENCIVIGADTVVAYNHKILGKPADIASAKEMLTLLSGSTHQVFTGVTLLYRKAGEAWQEESFYEQTDVTMYDLDTELIDAYIATKEPMDKAGAYGIQGQGAILVSAIHGDYNNVVGLPVGQLWHRLKKINKKTENINKF